ncbi:hypothetical protein Drose_00815 [Dactylosporangium roseum]|uniref:Helix-turn-helix domain-containing protein n=1 Tax=Dactylosporangium roseum TaxID=47989 RepID=A0ABY5Z956_9ACTN|nr:hypothetical protein [Dactylosporangium roseum]UWZ36914.1 hypothetical protein Drose_00815 [Dactylosporangium roseum]
MKFVAYVDPGRWLLPSRGVLKMTDDALLDQVRQMREQGRSPKQIAKELGLRPAAVASLVRQVAILQQSHDNPADRVLLGCWISPGWSVGLGLDETPPTWAALDPLGTAKSRLAGLANVLIVRQERASRVTACGFLVDVYCLGVKDAVGPLPMGSSAIEQFGRKFFSAFDDPPVSVPLELAQAVVHGAAAYARTLGFEPHPDFDAAAPYLGAPAAPSPIRFGREGKPFYISGPYDKPRNVHDTLETTVGAGNYDYMVHI